MCFSPQRRIQLLDIGPCKSAPKTTRFLTFSLPNVLFATAAYTIIGHRTVQKCSEDYSFLTFSLPNARFATAAYNYWTSDRPKVLRRLQFFNIFTSKCAFRHSGVQFFDGWRATSASDLTCFVHFHLQMCFSPQPRTIFQHENVPKWSKHVMFCAFSLPNVLFTTAACIFLISELTKVLRTRHVLYILTSECAFHHSGVHFFDIWTYKSAPNTSCFVHFDFRMCFSPQRRAIFAFFADHMTPHPPL